MKKETIALISVILLGVIALFSVYSRKGQRTTVILLSNENNVVCSEYLTQECAHEGKNSFKVAPHQVYGPTWNLSGKELLVDESDMLIFRYAVRSPDDCDGQGIKFSLTIHDEEGKQIGFEGITSVDMNCKDNEFEETSFTLPLKSYSESNYTFRFYFWNLHGKTFYLDNLSIESVE